MCRDAPDYKGGAGGAGGEDGAGGEAEAEGSVKFVMQDARQLLRSLDRSFWEARTAGGGLGGGMGGGYQAMGELGNAGGAGGDEGGGFEGSPWEEKNRPQSAVMNEKFQQAMQSGHGVRALEEFFAKEETFRAHEKLQKTRTDKAGGAALRRASSSGEVDEGPQEWGLTTLAIELFATQNLEQHGESNLRRLLFIINELQQPQAPATRPWEDKLERKAMGEGGMMGEGDVSPEDQRFFAALTGASPCDLYDGMRTVGTVVMIRDKSVVVNIDTNGGMHPIRAQVFYKDLFDNPDHIATTMDFEGQVRRSSHYNIQYSEICVHTEK